MMPTPVEAQLPLPAKKSELKASSAAEKIMIGLEIHAYLDTKSKLFCACSTQEGEPNTSCCPICLGHPGSKPVLNEKAIELGARIGVALNCTVNEEFFFSRKTYFYPDMSSNYQITQYEVPLAQNGLLNLPSGHTVRIRRAHLEWDPAALVHPNGMGKSQYVLIDYNRSGMPLVEIVTEPDIVSPMQAREFLNTLETLLSYLRVLRPDTTLKVDCNISLNGGKRVEVKNVSGYAAVEKALNYEISRQRQELRGGKVIEQHTRAFDAERGVTIELRKKETEEDYGYIFDPDLVRVSLSKEYLAQVKASLPELPGQKAARLQQQFNLPAYEARVLCSDYYLGELFDEMSLKLKADPLISARLLTRELLSIINHDSLDWKYVDIRAVELAMLVDLLANKKVSEKNAKQALINYISGDKTSPKKFLETNNLLISESIDLAAVIAGVIAANQKAVADYKAGNEKSFNFLAGMIMRKTKGTVSPQKVNEALKQELSQ